MRTTIIIVYVVLLVILVLLFTSSTNGLKCRRFSGRYINKAGKWEVKEPPLNETEDCEEQFPVCISYACMKADETSMKFVTMCDENKEKCERYMSRCSDKVKSCDVCASDYCNDEKFMPEPNLDKLNKEPTSTPTNSTHHPTSTIMSTTSMKSTSRPSTSRTNAVTWPKFAGIMFGPGKMRKRRKVAEDAHGPNLNNEGGNDEQPIFLDMDLQKGRGPSKTLFLSAKSQEIDMCDRIPCSIGCLSILARVCTPNAKTDWEQGEISDVMLELNSMCNKLFGRLSSPYNVSCKSGIIGGNQTLRWDCMKMMLEQAQKDTIATTTAKTTKSTSTTPKTTRVTITTSTTTTTTTARPTTTATTPTTTTKASSTSSTTTTTRPTTPTTTAPTTTTSKPTTPTTTPTTTTTKPTTSTTAPTTTTKTRPTTTSTKPTTTKTTTPTTSTTTTPTTTTTTTPTTLTTKPTTTTTKPTTSTTTTTPTTTTTTPITTTTDMSTTTTRPKTTTMSTFTNLLTTAPTTTSVLDRPLQVFYNVDKILTINAWAPGTSPHPVDLMMASVEQSDDCHEYPYDISMKICIEKGHACPQGITLCYVGQMDPAMGTNRLFELENLGNTWADECNWQVWHEWDGKADDVRHAIRVASDEMARNVIVRNSYAPGISTMALNGDNCALLHFVKAGRNANWKYTEGDNLKVREGSPANIMAKLRNGLQLKALHPFDALLFDWLLTEKPQLTIVQQNGTAASSCRMRITFPLNCSEDETLCEKGTSFGSAAT